MTTDQRIENLEKGLASARRFNRWLLAAVGLALGVWILAGTFGPTIAAAPAGGGAVKEVRANIFIVEDENGKTRASLGVLGGAPVLRLIGENGKDGAVLELAKNGGAPVLRLSGGNGKGGAVLEAGEDGGSLNMEDKNGQLRVLLLAGEDGSELDLLDKGVGIASLHARKEASWLTLRVPGQGLGENKGHATLAAGKDGPMLWLSDKNGQERASLAMREGGPELRVSDEKGNARATVGVTHAKNLDGRIMTYPESSMLLYGTDGKVIWQAR